MSKPKLCIITSRFPFPIEKGDKLRIYYQIKYLYRYYDITLCSLNEDAIRKEDIEEVKKYCKDIHVFTLHKAKILFRLGLKFLSQTPSQVSYFYDPSIKQKIHTIIKDLNPDHIYCHLIRCTEYVKELDYPKTLDYMDSFSLGMERRSKTSFFPFNIIFRRESKLLRKYEADIISQFNSTTIISENEKSRMQLEPKEKIRIISNGVDTDFFCPSPRKETYDLVFVGNMGYAPNIEAAKFIGKQLLPALLPLKPDIKILIAGARPSYEVKALQSDSIHISGWMDDIRDAYASAKIFIAPLFIGSGMQNKILEAMAMEKCCITTDLVNKAILAEADKSVVIANNVNDFTEKILFLLKNPEQRDKIAVTGFTFVKNNYSWSKSVELLHKIISSNEN